MSSGRKLRRAQLRLRERQESPKRFLLRDFLLVGGVIVAVFGLIAGLGQYRIYVAGRAEDISNSRLGTEYLPAVAPGDPGRRASAIAAFCVATVGAAVAVFSLGMLVIERRFLRCPKTQGDDPPEVSSG